MKIRILPAAQRDLEIGADFYELQRRGLGRYFNDCLSSDIEPLRLYAGIHSRLYGLQRCLSKRFPFAIFYECRDEVVEIYAVLDMRQDPASVEARLSSKPS